MTGKEALMRVRRMFTGGQWTRGAMHKIKNDKDYYCLVGGLRHVTGAYNDARRTPEGGRAYREAISLLERVIDTDDDPISFNDSHYRPEPVIEAIDRAIALDDEMRSAPDMSGGKVVTTVNA